MDTEIYYEDLQEISKMANGRSKVNEAKQPSHAAQDARDKLERARDEGNRALEELRRVQNEYDANHRIGSEIKSAMSACIEVEKVILTAIHKIENVIHRINKMASSPQSESVEKKSSKFLREDMEIEVPFQHEGQELVALFDVDAVVYKHDGKYELEDPTIRLLSITEQKDPSKEIDVKLSVPAMQSLQDEALEIYIEEFKEVT